VAIPVTISISGTTTPLTVLTPRTFSAAVTPSTNTAVTWSVVEAGGGSITAAGVYTAPASAGLFTVKAVSQADTSKNATLQVQVVAAPAISSFSTSSAFAFPTQGVTLTPVFSNGTAAISPGVGTVTSGVAYPLTPTASTTYTLTVTNAAGSVMTSDVNITFSNQAPSVTSLTATPGPLVEFGQTATVNWSLAGGPATSLLFAGTNVTGQSSSSFLPERRFAYALNASNPVGAAPTQYITIAARGLDIFSGNAGGQGYVDGPAAQAQFTYLWYMTKDSAGNYYLADGSSCTIRKVTPAGVVSTFAGSAFQPGSVDGTGSAAQFSYPTGVAFDANGNLFVADSSNHTIRKITPAGVVTTFAGQASVTGNLDGLGTAASFRNPNAVAFDTAGNLYVSDASAKTIRKITSSGQVTTLAGLDNTAGSVDAVGSAARFNTLRALLYHPALNCLFIADAGNSTLRKLDLATNAVTTEAGTAGTSGSIDGSGAAARLNWTCGLALDNQGNVLLSDWSSNLIRRFVPATKAVTTLAGNGADAHADGAVASASFHGPVGLWVEANGDILVTDYTGGTLRKIAGGQVTTVAGTPAKLGSADGSRLEASFNVPTALGKDSVGNILVLDRQNYTIRKLNAYGTATTLAGSPGLSGSTDGTGSAARFAYSYGSTIGVDSAGNSYIGDSYNHTLRKVTPAGVVTTLAGLAGATGLATGTGAAARFNYPAGTAVDSAGNIYVAEYGSYAIRKVTPAGVVTNFAGLPGTSGNTEGVGTAARFGQLRGIAIDGADNLFVPDPNNYSIRKITPAGVVTTWAGGTYGFTDGQGIAAKFVGPVGITALADGTLYVTETGNLVRKITPAGLVSTLAGTPNFYGSHRGPLPGTLYSPTGILMLGSGDLITTGPDGITQITGSEGN
jgi:sugar lactone lactonase YvrE